MADDNNATGDGKKKGIGAPIAIGGAVVLAAISGAAAFALAPSSSDGDMHTEENASDDEHGVEKHASSESHGGESKKKSAKKKKSKNGKSKGGGPVYVPLEPLIISLGPEAQARRLKITLVVEGDADYESELTALVPKFRDVLNTYLRAADARDFESPASMSRVRAHIARRLKIVAPEDSIESVLVTDFILD